MTPVRAAGGVVWRHTAGGGVQVCLVHRPRYDDWTLPKGKLEPGEHPMRAAVREVAEEADVYGVPQIRLPRIRYLTRDGLPKLVDFWSMRAVAYGGFQPNTEVDDMRWLTVDEAVRLATYPHDEEVLTAFAGLPEVTGVLGLVRHALAGKRNTWSGPDAARPLDAAGWAQALELAPLLALLRPQRLLAASVRRCVQTLDPLADLLDLPIEVDSSLDEPAPGQDGVENALASAARLAELAQVGPAAVVCSQGKVIPRAIACLAVAAGSDADAGGRAGLGAAAVWSGAERGSTEYRGAEPGITAHRDAEPGVTAHRSAGRGWAGPAVAPRGWTPGSASVGPGSAAGVGPGSAVGVGPGADAYGHDADAYEQDTDSIEQDTDAVGHGADAADPDVDWRTPKGGGWLLAFHGARLVAADRI